MTSILGTSNRVFTPAERYFIDSYPDYELASYSSDAFGVLNLELKPLNCPICPVCGQPCKVHSTVMRTVRCAPRDGHAVVKITTPIRRVRCEHCGSRATETIPWLPARSHLTYKLIAYLQFYLREGATISSLAKSLQLNWETVKNIDKEQLLYAFKTMDLSNVKHLIMDEFAFHKRHKYATVVMDAETNRAIAVYKGKSGNDVKPFFQMLIDKGIDVKIKSVSMDMNAAFPALVREFLPHAVVLYDGFHVLQMFTRDVLVKARIRAQQDALENYKDSPSELKIQKKLLNGSQWILVRPPEKLEADEKERLEELRRNNKLLADLYPLVELIRAIWACKDQVEATRLLKHLHTLGLSIAREHDFPPVRTFVQTLKRRMEGIVQVGRFGYSSCPLEGANNKIKVLKRKAYGFRDFEYFKLKIFAILPGKRENPFWNLNFSTAVFRNRVVKCQFPCGFHANP